MTCFGSSRVTALYKKSFLGILSINRNLHINMPYSNKQKHISICHGQNCRDVGGKTLAEKFATLGIDVGIIPCQSLCTYAPTAKVGNIAILHASMDKLLGETDD